MADAVTQHDPSRFTGLKTCESFRLLECTRVELLRTVTPGSFVLAVSGEKPYANMEVMLSPLTYVQQPEYWGIEVVGWLPHGFGLTMIAPYTVTIPLDGIIGSEGIEVIGSNRTESMDVPRRE